MAAAPPEAAAAPRSAAARTYRLIANDAALTPHTGKKIEVTGTLDDAGASGGVSSGSPGLSASAANAPKLTVE
ncbi:MAG: hypothetical protein GEU82_15110, partial [Luteitalea sp.]|nr:hypothetical protein [Luteitalea sp.]